LTDNNDETLDAIERTQAALRTSIAQATDLAEKSDRLIRKHRKKVDKS